jgi:RND superfamily putative drug exporter
MTGVLYRLAQFCVKRRLIVAAVWLVVTVALVAISHGLGDNTNDNLSLPGTDSQRATDALKHSFPAQADGTSPIVLHASNGTLTAQKNANAIDQAVANLSENGDVASAISPLSPQGASQLSKDGATGYIAVTLAVTPGSLSESATQNIIDAAAKPAEAAGLQVETAGQLGQKVSKPSTESSELVGIIAAMIILTIIAAMIILTITFGSVASMLLPIVTAIFALLSTLAVIRMLGHVATVPTLATMIGLGVGIDYALFIVTRHFRGLHDGLPTGRGGAVDVDDGPPSV